jgi:hypothetical protein
MPTVKRIEKENQHILVVHIQTITGNHFVRALVRSDKRKKRTPVGRILQGSKLFLTQTDLKHAKILKVRGTWGLQSILDYIF